MARDGDKTEPAAYIQGCVPPAVPYGPRAICQLPFCLYVTPYKRLANTHQQIQIPSLSKAEILNALPRLGLCERREIFEPIGEMEEQDLLKDGEPTAEEKALLDRELKEFRQNPQAGSTWAEVEARLRKPVRS